MTRVAVDTENEGVRLDRFLRKRLALSSLSTIYRMLRTGAVRVDGKKKRQHYRIRAGETIDIDIDAAELTAADRTPDARIRDLHRTAFFKKNFHVLFEDDDLLVCNKPAGLVVHGGTGHQKRDTLVDCAWSYLQASGTRADSPENLPQLVHRLDRDTSGVIVLAKRKPVLRMLHEALREHRIEKEYCALCHGRPPRKRGRIELGLQRSHGRDQGMKMRVDRDGMHSVSEYRVDAVSGAYSRCYIQLYTGRTHQIRIHLAHIGCPILGDERYGDAAQDRELFRQHPGSRRLFLHAQSLRFEHPVLHRMVTFTAPAPPLFSRLWEALR